LSRARDLLVGTRLLTLTGPGGCGKTRLAMELADSVSLAFVDGVSFVSLAAVRDPALVPVSIAQALGLQDARRGSLLAHLSAYLDDRHVLLVLDNVEQVLAASGFVGDLLAATTAPRILVTSRAPLHLSWEQEFPVPPLQVPEPGSALSADVVAACESVELFAARAAASVPGFTVDDENAAAVADIVRRLDGLPLAIELAAARVKVLPPAAILTRLEDSLGLLVSERRDAPGRQQTLRATIAWSHDLLSEDARRLLAACSVFRGGVDLARLEVVCAAAMELPVPVLSLLAELVDHSLLRRASPGSATARFAMLETVREFAAQRLVELPERNQVCAAHARVFWDLVSDLPRPPACPDRAGLDLLELEHDNVRAALEWYAAGGQVVGLRMANRLTGFWSVRGYFSEGRRRLSSLLGLDVTDDAERMDALAGAGWLATDQGDSVVAVGLLDESLASARAAHDVVREAIGLYYRGRARMIAGDWMAAGQSDIEQALTLLTGTGDQPTLAAVLWLAGAAAHARGDDALAIERYERSAELCAAFGLPAVEGRVLQLLGVSRLELGDVAGARAALAVGVPAIVDIGDRFAIPVGLTALAGLAVREGRTRAAFRLVGAAADYEEVNQTHLPHALRVELDAWLAPARRALGPTAQQLMDEGRGLTLAEALALGFDEAPQELGSVAVSPTLTRRERQVADLVSTGLTNREIAATLYLSVRTVEVHVDHILTKLGFRTRTRLSAWVHEQAGRADTGSP
jgi:predicted ATPase/DNA-binding CsgD family transcriptional regulator